MIRADEADVGGLESMMIGGMMVTECNMQLLLESILREVIQVLTGGELGETKGNLDRHLGVGTIVPELTGDTVGVTEYSPNLHLEVKATPQEATVAVDFTDQRAKHETPK